MLTLHILPLTSTWHTLIRYWLPCTQFITYTAAVYTVILVELLMPLCLSLAHNCAVFVVTLRYMHHIYYEVYTDQHFV